MEITRNNKEFDFVSEYYFDINEDSLILIKDNIYIGFANVKLRGKELFLFEIEIFKEFKNKGYGKVFINKLFEYFPKATFIKGYALDESKFFFKKIGANFLNPVCLNCSYCPYSNKSECDDYFDSYFLLEKQD